MSMPPKDKNYMKTWVNAGRQGAVGIEIALSIVVGYFGGRYLDHLFGTSFVQWIGLVLGLGAAIKVLVRLAKSDWTKP